MNDLPGVDPDGKIPGGIEVAGNVEAHTITRDGVAVGAPYPGVTGDGQTPGGLIVSGSLVAGEQHAADSPSFNLVYGNLVLRDTPGNVVDGDPILQMKQWEDNTPDSSVTEGANLNRNGSIADNDYAQPFIIVRDSTASSQSALSVHKPTGTGRAIDIDGKLGTNDTATHTLGAYSGAALPIYDTSGVLLGYIPIYA